MYIFVLSQLRCKMQSACKNTKTLPTDLWNKFKTADDDGSGRLEVTPLPLYFLLSLLTP